MNTEAVQTFADRPAFVSQGTGRVAIGVHDAWYLRERAHWRQKLAQAHTDPSFGGTGSTRQLDRVKAAYEAWKAEEEAWYATHGLVPPAASALRLHAVEQPARVHRQSARQRILAYHAAHPNASITEIVDALQVTRQNVHQTLSLARKGGRELGPTQWQRVIAVLEDGVLHTSAEIGAAARVPSAAVPVMVKRLRARGFHIVTVTDGQRFYQLVPSTWTAA